ncbi:hypothetical protein LXL04_027075 [Taraxacum kok-saghyz]
MTSSPSPSTENHSSDVVTDAATLSKTKDLSSDHIDNEEEEEEEEEEDEEGDIDFNPFLKDPPSLEPSSSLSSDIEEFHADVDSTSHHHHNRPPVENTEHSQQTVTQVPDSYDTEPNKPIVNSDDNDDDEDAIWRRTRARYSLVGSTLDELETFLQETDDEDDLHHNIDDEQEYRKFLAAVLQQDGDPSLLATQATENLDEEEEEEDEDNDADFELELEEALESDIDERRPETRHQKKRQKTDVHNKKETNNKNNNSIRPLRPILPYAPISHSPYMMIQNTGLTSKECPTPFMPHQIGQLHCLIYEHVQLLVQVFSVSVLEPSRQHIASQLHGLLLEIVNKRDRVLASRKVPYPSFCFSLPYIQSTVSLQNNMSECEWVPFVTENVTSVIDVAPLNLLGSYLTDVSNVVHEHQRRRLEVAYDGSSSSSNVDKECLFPFGNFSYVGDSDQQPSTTAGSSRSNEPRAKKTIAATAVEKSRMQSIAFVPKEIARLALQFFPLFNPALFPHKPPPVSVANRFLFTDAEDGLLARGLMEYNTNWKEIQKHFLPCKTPHQIFVRQKNRACSRAPENPIKAVRRWKTSPLSPQEKALIEEGLRVYKLDWMAVWKYMVPHRDPTLLARQYRTAVGNQKSYKGDELKKAKRRSYESNRRKLKLQKSTNKEGWSTEDDTTPIFTKHKQTFVSENAPEETNSDNDNETYVHEAFLSDWRPENHDKLPNYPLVVNYHQHPYRARKSNGSRVVKLAPDLPPVNLPPSVRIMSQSAFSKYNEVSSSNNKSGQLEERNSSNTTGKGDSDHQMHPLLFHDNEDASLPYYPLNPPVDFFPNNNNLFRYSHQEKHTVNFFNNVKSKELGVEFHPLLQRTEDGIGDSGVVIPEVGKERIPGRSPSELDLDIRLSSSVRNRGLRDGIGDSGVGNDGIVMEQEELSDSEEVEEDESVEFECEEMTDSEGGSDSDHFENVQNQDVEGEGTTSTCKSDVAVGLSLNNHRNSRSSKSTTLETPPPPPQVKKPRKRAQKQVK